MLRFNAALVMASCVHTAQSKPQASGICAAPDFGPHVDMSSCTEIIPPDSCTVRCAAGYIGNPTTLHCYSDDDGMLGSSPECSAAPEGTASELATRIVSEVAEDTSSRQLPADERQLEGATTTTQIPGTCAVPDLGARVDSSDCQGKTPSETCEVKCTSSFVGTAVSYLCNSDFTLSGKAPNCNTMPSSADLQSVRDELNVTQTRVVKDTGGSTPTVAENVSVANLIEGTLTIVGADGDKGASVTVPKAFFDLLGDSVVVVISADPEPLKDQTTSDGTQVEVQGVMSIHVSIKGNIDPTVQGLSQPIAINMGNVSIPTGKIAECAFYNETTAKWSTSGLETESTSSGIVCKTSHLTVFGVLVVIAPPTPAPTPAPTPTAPVCGYSLGAEVYYGETKATVTCFSKVNGEDALGVCLEGGGKHSHFSACESNIHTQCKGQLTFVGCSAVSDETLSGSFRATAASMLGLMLAITNSLI
jgi:hypothetical protein